MVDGNQPHPPSLSAGSSRWRLAPFLLLALVAALYCGTGMVQAVDTWWGLAAGAHEAWASGLRQDGTLVESDHVRFTVKP